MNASNGLMKHQMIRELHSESTVNNSAESEFQPGKCKIRIRRIFRYPDPDSDPAGFTANYPVPDPAGKKASSTPLPFSLHLGKNQ